MGYLFTIVTPGRCGSEHVIETLNSYGDIDLPGEVFNRTNHSPGSFNNYLNQNTLRKGLGFMVNREKLSRLKLNIPLKILINDFLKHGTNEERIMGFKLTLDQLFAYPHLFTRLVNMKVIYLNRKNRLDQVLSLLKARKSGVYHSRSTSKERNVYQFDPLEVIGNINQFISWESQFLQHMQPREILHLSYEKVFTNYNETILQIREFLGLAPKIPPKASTILKNEEHPEDWLINFREIKELLKEKGLVEFLQSNAT